MPLRRAERRRLTIRLEDYLERIGVEVDPSQPPSGRQLELLHRRHLLTVPFENLDIHWGVPIRLDEAAILQKVIRKGRGGFCYELNTAFAWLLRQLGYRVEMLSAEVERPDKTFGIPHDHMLLRVTTNRGVASHYLADVGFGDSFRAPLPLPLRGVSEQEEYSYRLAERDSFVHLERAPRAQPEEFTTQYRFTWTAHQLKDYQSACHFHQTSEESLFTQRPLVTLALSRGRITLLSDRLLFTRDGETEEVPLADSSAWSQALKIHFHIESEE